MPVHRVWTSSLMSASLIVIGTLSISACSPPTASTEGPVKVLIVEVKPATSSALSITGTIHAKVESDLGFRVGGKIATRLVNLGESVHKGQVLMRLDPSDLQKGETSAAANLAATQAQYDRASASESRLKSLLATGAVAPDAYEQAKAVRDSAAAALRAAQAQRDLVHDQAGYALLVADSDGLIMSISAEAGQVVEPGQTVLRIAADGPREAAVLLADSQATAPPSQVKARPFGQDDTVLNAHLRQISKSADPMTRGYEARYVLEAAPESLPLGSTVTLTLPNTSDVSSVSLPLSALLDTGQGTHVWVVDPKRQVVTSRPVKVERLTEDSVEIASGLNAGDVVVAAGAQLLHHGDHVAVIAKAQP